MTDKPARPASAGLQSACARLKENYSLQVRAASHVGFTKEADMVREVRIQRSVTF